MKTDRRVAEPLCKQILDHFPVDVSQAEIAAFEPIGQPLVIDAEAVHDRCLKIVNVDAIFYHVVAVVVGATVIKTRLDAAPGHPDAKTSRMVIAAILLSAIVLTVGSAAKLAAPDH